MEPDQMRESHLKECKSIVFGVGFDEPCGITRNRQSTGSNPKQDLPRADDAKQEAVVRIPNEVARLSGELRAICRPPKKYVRIEERSQSSSPSKYRWISGGRGSLKFAGTTKSPSALPGTRRALSGILIGDRRATGCPARAISTSSPRATLRRSFEKWVLAS
jgi:hypothetical protein